MIDKVQKILDEITVRKLCTMDEHMAFYNNNAKEDYRFLSEIEEFIKASQEKPVSEPQVKESAKIQHVNDTCKENGNSLTQEPVSEDLEEAANNALNDVLNTHEIVNVRSCLEMFKFGAKWQAEQFEKTLKDRIINAYNRGMKQMKKQMMVNAIDGDITFDYYGDDDKTYGCVAHDSFCLEDFGLKDKDEVRMILIKEL